MLMSNFNIVVIVMILGSEGFLVKDQTFYGFFPGNLPLLLKLIVVSETGTITVLKFWHHSIIALDPNLGRLLKATSVE